MADTVPSTRGHGLLGWAPTGLALGLFLYFLGFLPGIGAGGVAEFATPWIPALGIDLAFRIDGLSLTFALLISGIGALVLFYANSYLAGDPQFDRFVLFLTAFMLSMLGLVLADDLILLFVFWELTTITSYLLIGYGHESAKSRRNALQALFLTGAGALAFLAGLILLASAAGTTRISEILAQGAAIQAHPHYGAILILFLLGAFTKSAQVPFHFWLPNAMAAPTPVSAFLHSATMVKAGVYLLARMHPALSGSTGWLLSLTLLGGITAVFASILALRQTDLKQALAYTTLMALGTLTMLLGQSSAYAMTAFATFLVVHSLYKAALFLLVGNLDAATGTRETDALRGLGPRLPGTALAAALAAFSMAGLPPFLGFIGKELKYAGAVAAEGASLWMIVVALSANGLMLAVALIVGLRPFWRGMDAPTPIRNAVPWPMVIGPMILAILGLVLGLVPGLIQTSLIAPTVAALSNGTVNAKELTLWHGVNLPLILSLATFALGFFLYGIHRPLRRTLAAIEPHVPDMDAWWDRFMEGIKAFATLVARRVQTGRMGDYLTVTFGTIAASLLLSILARGLPPLGLAFSPVGPLELGLGLLILAGAGLVLLSRSRITAVAALGVVGIGVALLFIFFGAPDVAITQLMVEVLIVVLIAVVMLQLPFLARPTQFRPGHAVISLGVGLAVTLMLLGVLSQPLDLRLTEFFETASWPEAYGRNIVNVILVDFRALDTFGEVAVVVMAAVSAIALLRQPKGDGK